jgi:hypothetical protein
MELSVSMVKCCVEMDNICVTSVDHVLYCYQRRQDSRLGMSRQPETMLMTQMILNKKQGYFEVSAMMSS